MHHEQLSSRGGGRRDALGQLQQVRPWYLTFYFSEISGSLRSKISVGLYYSSGYLAVDTANKRLILAFRGAELTGLLVLASLYLAPCPTICAACNCFDGIYNSWITEARPIVAPLLATYLPMYPGYKLIVTGHSLGASQAIYAAAEIRNNGTNATVVSYPAYFISLSCQGFFRLPLLTRAPSAVQFRPTPPR